MPTINRMKKNFVLTVILFSACQDPAAQTPSPSPESSSSSTPTPVSSSVSPPNSSTVAPTEVAEEFRELLPQIKQQTQVPILLPSQLLITKSENPIYIYGQGETDGYRIGVGFVPNCNATACSIGELTAERGGEPYPEEFSKEVTLAQGITGYFQPLSCGASCAPPIIGWEHEDVFYRIALKGTGRSPEEEEANLTQMANSAIEAGGR